MIFVCANSVIKGLKLCANFGTRFPNIAGKSLILPRNKSRCTIFGAILPRTFKIVISKTLANTIGKKKLSHARLTSLCVGCCVFASE